MKLALGFILSGGIVITLLVLFLLVKSKKSELPQKILIVLFSLLLFVIVYGYAQLNRIIHLYIFSFIFNDTFEWFIGPLLYVYVKSLFLDEKSLFKKNIYHFLPFACYTILFSIPIFIYIISDKYVVDYLEPLLQYGDQYVIIRNAYLIIYIIVSIRLFFKYTKLIKHHYSSLEDKDLVWIKQLLVGMLIVCSTDLTFILYQQYIGYLEFNLAYFTIVVIVLLIGYLGYFGLNQSKILLPNFLFKETNQKAVEKSSYVLNFSLKEQEELKSRLFEVLKTKRPYLDEDLTLIKLAELIPTTNKKLSTLLNKYMNTSFYTMVNKYRVEEVKEILKSNKYNHLTLLGIAYESGFKSKTTFNRIFKNETGLSPSKYKQTL